MQDPLHEMPGQQDLADRDSSVGRLSLSLTALHSAVEQYRSLATVLFTDVVGSTERAVDLGDRDWLALLRRHNRIVREELVRFRGCELHSVGDGFVATFGGPTLGVRCAAAIIDKLQPLGIKVRSGVHTGEVEIDQENVGGIALHTAARIAAVAAASEILVSSTVRDLVAGSGLRFHDRGCHELRGLPEPLRLFAADASRVHESQQSCSA